MLKHSVRFKLQHSKDRTGSKPVVLRCVINYNNKEVVFNSGLKIEPQYWNQKKQEPRQNILFKTISKFKTDLKNVNDWADKAFEHLSSINKEYPDAVLLKDLCDTMVKNDGVIPGTKNKETTTDLMSFIEKVITDTKSGARTLKDGKRFAPLTYKGYGTTKSALTEFMAYQKIKTLTFSDINLEFYSDFRDWCYNTALYTDNYFGKHIKNIKMFMNEAADAGLHNSTSHKHKKFITTRAEVENIYLNQDQLEIIASFDFKKDKKSERVRDLFLVGCWTGLRFSDFSNIQPKNIQGDYIEIKTQKTGETVAIPIHPTILSIMERYKGVTPNSLPPSISNVKLNEYIKEAAKKTEKLSEPVSLEKSKAGKKIIITKPLYELISTHTARRTFATNMFKMGIPSMIIMKITGHRTQVSFEKYIKVTSKESAEIMREIWNRQTMKAVK